MRIAFFTDTFLPQINGIATSIAGLADELGRQGHHVLIIAPSVKGVPMHEKRSQRVTVVRLKSVPLLLYPDYRIALPRWRKIFRELREFSPDIIHFHTPFTMGLQALLASKILKKPLVGTNHIYLTPDNPDFTKCVPVGNRLIGKIVAKSFARYFRLLYHPCALRTAPSQVLVDCLRKEGIVRNAEILPNGLSPYLFGNPSATEEKAMRQRFRLEPHVVVHMGRLSPEKSPEIVIRAFALVRQHRSDVSLLIIGDGPAKRGLERLTKKLGLEQHVHFTGMIPHEKLLASGMLCIADLFVTASTTESQGMALVEAMFSGLPIVCVRGGAAEEVVGKAALIVKPGDTEGMAKAIERVLATPLLAKSLSMAGRKRAPDFRIDRVVSGLTRLYTDLLARKFPAPQTRIHRSLAAAFTLTSAVLRRKKR